MLYLEQNCLFEWSYCSSIKYNDPFNEIELSVEIIDPDGIKILIPAFWHGGEYWTIRYASHKVGRHYFTTLCSDTNNNGLHGKAGALDITEYKGKNPLLKHGPLKVSEDRRHIEHIDGTPFLWLADTWWMGFYTMLI